MHVRGGLHHWPRVVTQHSVLRYSYRGACAPGAAVSVAMSPAPGGQWRASHRVPGPERAICRRRCHAVTL